MIWYFLLAIYVAAMMKIGNLLGTNDAKNLQGRMSIFTKNMKRPSNFIINSRNHKIYYRICLPKEMTPKATLFFTHGLGSHCNRLSYKWFIYHLNQLGYAVVLWDHEGYGYSEGMRGYIKDYKLLVADGIRVIEKTLETNSKIKSLPFFVGGHSMGGAVTLLIGNQIQNSVFSWNNMYRGAVLLSPAIKAPLPPLWLVTILEHLVVPCMPTRCVPSILDPTGNLEDSFIFEADRKYAIQDSNMYPGGLSHQKPMMFKTASTLIKLFVEIQETMKNKAFTTPTLICHDPNDKICLFEGSQDLIQVLSHSKVASSSLEIFPGKRHDLMANCVEELIERIDKWMKNNLSQTKST